MFFAIEHRLWGRVCDLGMNAAIAYLILARGTGPDNRTSSWSHQAIEKYTGIARYKAREAIDRLCEEGLAARFSDGLRPGCTLASYEELHRVAMTGQERLIYENVAAGRQPSRKSQKTIASRLVRKGLLARGNQDFYQIREVKPEWIWLPNALVTGAGGETPPIELMRQTQDPLLLRLLVDLYDAQNLLEHGGISRFVIHQEFERIRVGEQGALVVWGFRDSDSKVAYGGSAALAPHLNRSAKESSEQYEPIWRRVRILESLGLIEWIPYLFESENRDAELIHPCGMGGSEAIEDLIGRAAHDAGLTLLTQGQIDWATAEGLRLVPLPRHLDNVTLCGIARLRYRARTKLTGAWFADSRSNGSRWLAQYEKMLEQKNA